MSRLFLVVCFLGQYFIEKVLWDLCTGYRTNLGSASGCYEVACEWRESAHKGEGESFCCVYRQLNPNFCDFEIRIQLAI